MNAAIFPLVFLIIFGATVMFCDGRIGGPSERCLCQKTNLQKRVKLQLVETVQVFNPSASCSYTEMIITLRNGRKFCLDLIGRQGRRILSGKNQKKQSKGKTNPRQKGKKQKKNKQQV
ncbi:C-X-C motif chemokine 9-like [Silurus meridionalis]|uniref:Chemokine interleukin-8-like domain-containing protein n=1 Tax=Silurus meridionalis TaxID=175797 RepID=A0A8T0A871_SILME|nr:C-X-C motif chemokine 9-like [Silurus meridionalis]KAF7687459.1 hypothetical protein HF521_014687 [Silurus meridionalis]